MTRMDIGQLDVSKLFGYGTIPTSSIKSAVICIY